MADSEVKNRVKFEKNLCLCVLQHTNKSQDTGEIIKLNTIPLQYLNFSPPMLIDTIFMVTDLKKKDVI